MNTEKNTNVNFHTLARQLTPTALRCSVWNALMGALMAPFRRINADHAAFLTSKRTRMTHNGQTRLLECVANLLMTRDYDTNNPVIRISESEPIEEFLIAPGGGWATQGIVHFDQTAKDHWDYHNRPEAPELYGILYDGNTRSGSLGFEVRMATCLSETAPYNKTRESFLRNGGRPALADIIDTYKLAGKQYALIQD